MKTIPEIAADIHDATGAEGQELATLAEAVHDAVKEFGDPIYVYTSEQAIEDGVLVQPFPDKFPGWLFTAGVHAAIEAASARKASDPYAYARSAIPLLMDAAMIVRSRRDHLHTEGLEGNVTGKTVWIGQNEIGGYTLMFPEDY